MKDPNPGKMLAVIDGDLYYMSYEQFLNLLEIIAETGSLEAEGGGVYTNGKRLGGPVQDLSNVNTVEALEILGESTNRIPPLILTLPPC